MTSAWACAASSGALWVAVETVPPIASDTVHVWRAETAQLRGVLPALARLLDRAERARAAAFHAATDAERYVAAHGVLRFLLGKYLGAHPSSVEFGVGAQGKPHLAAAAATSRVAFNMSHTHDVVVFAFAHARAVGVDVERWCDVEYLELAQHFFSRREGVALAALDRRAVRRAFFDCWSRKEAYVKATGLGVSRGLDHFDVSMEPGDSAAILGDSSAPDAVLRWRMRDLGFPPGHSGAIVGEGRDWELQRFAVTGALLE